MTGPHRPTNIYNVLRELVKLLNDLKWYRETVRRLMITALVSGKNAIFLRLTVKVTPSIETGLILPSVILDSYRLPEKK